MDSITAQYLIDRSESLSREADFIMDTTGNGNLASILRQAAWKIEESVPQEYRVENLIKRVNKDE